MLCNIVISENLEDFLKDDDSAIIKFDDTAQNKVIEEEVMCFYAGYYSVLPFKVSVEHWYPSSHLLIFVENNGIGFVHFPMPSPNPVKLESV